jgi:hypothetical protein
MEKTGLFPTKDIKTIRDIVEKPKIFEHSENGIIF